MRVPIFLLSVVLFILCVSGQFFPPAPQFNSFNQYSLPQPVTAQFSLQLNIPFSANPNTQQLANTWFSLIIAQQFQLSPGAVAVIRTQPVAPGNNAQQIIIFGVTLLPDQVPSVTANLMSTYSGLIQQLGSSVPSVPPFVGGQVFSAADSDETDSTQPEADFDEVNLAEFDEALSNFDENDSNSASIDEALSSDPMLGLNPQQYVPNPQYSPLYVAPVQRGLPLYTRPRPLFNPAQQQPQQQQQQQQQPQQPGAPNQQAPGTPNQAQPLTPTQQIYGPPMYNPYNPYVNIAASTGVLGAAATQGNSNGDGSNAKVDTKWLIIGCSAGGGALLLMLLLYCVFVRKRFKRDITDDNFTRHHVDSISIHDNFVHNPVVVQDSYGMDKTKGKYYY